MKVKILKKRSLNCDITEFTLEKPWSFEAGQYTTICHSREDGSPAYHPFSIASSPLDTPLTLHIQNSKTHPLNPEFAHFLEAATTLEITKPEGKAILHQHNRPLLLIAGGSGFAPMKSIIETAMTLQPEREIYLYWGVRHPDCLYLPELIESWQKNLHFHFVPVLSEDQDPSYRHGLVHEAVLKDFASLGTFDIYLAGPFPMSYTARDSFLKKGAKLTHLFSDAFAFA